MISATVIRKLVPHLIWCFLFTSLVALLGCGNESSDSKAESSVSSNQGTLSYQMVFAPRAVDPDEQPAPVPPSGNVCQDYLITRIKATIFDDQANSVVVSEEEWNCDIPDRRKTFEGISPSTNLRVVLQGLVDVEGEPQPRWQGVKSNIKVEVEKNTDAGQIILRYGGTDEKPPKINLTTPSDGYREAPLNSAITVRFSEDIVPYSLEQEMLFLHNNKDNTRLICSYNPDVDYNAELHQVTFWPESDLEELAEYSVTLKSTGDNKVQDRSGNELDQDYSWTFFTAPIPSIWHVDGTVSSSGDGTSWDRAFKTIQEAIDRADESKYDEVWVKFEIYELSSPILVNKRISIYGGFQGFEKSRSERKTNFPPNIRPEINPDGSVQEIEHLLIISSSHVTIDIFEFSFGGWGIEGKEEEKLYGGAIYGDSFIENISVTNCDFWVNFANSGGAIYFDAINSLTIKNCGFDLSHATVNEGGAIFIENGYNIEIIDCYFDGNDAPKQGGAISFFNCETPILTNCVFHYNAVLEAGGKGGAIYWLYSSPKIVNCTFFGNQNSWFAFPEADGLSIYGNDGSPIIFNSIFWNVLDGNEGPEIVLKNSTPNVSFCNVKGGYEGTNNINIDPLFVDRTRKDYHLSSNSPCIDTGSNAATNLPDTDYDGNPRIANGTVDMGAYEFQP